jgi:rRNA small subunit pseudouridine methyltransferase Nep1
LLLNFVLAESALELVPEGMRRSPAVVADAKRRGKEPSMILLDRSFHHSAMERLEEGEKRGRPDLVHQALLSVTCTPLYLDGKVRVFVQTCAGLTLELEKRTRIPKNYIRFRGLMEKVLMERPGGGLVKVFSASMKELVRRTVSPDEVFGLSVRGERMKPEALASAVVAARNPCVLVGGFPHGHFSKETSATIDRLIRIEERPLEAHVVAARVVYEVEKASDVTND